QAGGGLLVTAVGTSVVDHLILNTRKPPFDNLKLRQAVSRTVDSRALITAVYQGGAVIGTSMAPAPYGIWGLAEGDMRALPGYGQADDEKTKARALLAEAGFPPGQPLKLEMLTRALPAFADLSSFVVSELRRAGIEVSVRQVETSQWHPMQARGEFQIGTDRNGIEPDDPDANFYEYFACGSLRNYSGYCDERIARLIEQQSQELDAKKRRAPGLDLQKRIEGEAPRPGVRGGLDYFTIWPHVKNLVPHHSIYGWGRLQEVWRDR